MAGVQITVDDFGQTKQPGSAVDVTVKRYTFTNENGAKVQVFANSFFSLDLYIKMYQLPIFTNIVDVPTRVHLR